MSWTIKELLAIPVDEVPIHQPIEGTVKVAMPVKTHEKYGDSQFLVVEDGTGEIAVDYKAPKPEVPLVAVEKGERVRIQAQMYKNKLTGAKKEVYESKGERKTKITVYGNRLTNLSRQTTASPASAPSASVQTAQGASLPPGLLSAPIPEAEAVEAYWRLFERMAGKLSRYYGGDDLETFMRGEDFPVDLCQKMASDVFRGILAGSVAPDKGRAATPSTTSKTPEEEYFDDDIPFWAVRSR